MILLQFHRVNDKLTFYERAGSSLGELRNHFMEALGNKYIDEEKYNHYSNKMKEIGFLLNRLIWNIKKARDVYGNIRKLKRNSSRKAHFKPCIGEVISSRRYRLHSIR
jgi:hypothetical protein